MDDLLILVAEDDRLNAKIYMDSIESMGYRAELAIDGLEAVRLCQELNPSLIIMDIQMPGMHGLEAIRRIRSLPEHSETPIVALTALAMAGDREKCLEAGADQYLSKPVPLRTLGRVIHSYISGPRPE